MKTFDHGRLRQIRRQKKLKLTEAARKINKSGVTLSNYENGKSDIGAALLVKLCAFYEVAPEDFFVETVRNKRRDFPAMCTQQKAKVMAIISKAFSVRRKPN